MVTMNQEMSKVLADSLQRVLKPVGFRKKGMAFVRDKGEVLHVVSIQKSDVSNANYIRATVNIGVYSKRLAEKMKGPSFTVSESMCHERRRIGFLIPEHTDTWWEVPDLNAAVIAGDEMASAVEKYAIPWMDSLSTTAALIEVWNAESKSSTLKIPALYLELLSA